MNVLEARVVLRDRTLLDSVDLAVRFVAHYARAYAALAALVVAPAFLVTLAIALAGGWGWGWAAAIALGPFVAAPFTALASRLLFEPSVRLREVLASTASALPRLFALRLLEWCALLFLGVFFVVPALWPLALFFYVNEVTVLERATVGTGLARLQRLLSGQSGDAVMALLFLTALHVVAVFLGDAVGRSLLQDLLEISPPPSIFQAKGSALALGAFWAFVPFGATCRFLQYVNARTRTEGWDVQTRFAAIAARAAAERERESIAPGTGGVKRVAIALVARARAARRGSPRAEPLDPGSADAIVAEARAQGADGFCKSPERPLDLRARSLCPLASELRDCDALVAACNDDPFKERPREESRSIWESLASLLGALANATVWIVIAAVVAALGWLIVRAAMRARRDGAAEEKPGAPPATVTIEAPAEALETTTDAQLLLRRAAEHVSRGDLDGATALYLAASLRALDHRGAIRIARHRTNGEYVRSCKEPAAKPDLRAIVREVDRVQFGREPATSDRVAEVASRATAIVARSALLTIAIAFAVGGCVPSAAKPLRASDPAGDDLLLSLLEREGVSVSRPSASLATLPIPNEDETPPLLIVDAARIPLEDSTRAHLARWVEAGGQLVLAGDVRAWPDSFEAKTKRAESVAVNVLVEPDDADGDDDKDESIRDAAYKTYPAKVASPASLEWPHASTLAATDKHELYAGVRGFKRGAVIGLAGDDLLTNAGIARPPNAAALVALLSTYARGRTVVVARPEDGFSPPDEPGLGPHCTPGSASLSRTQPSPWSSSSSRSACDRRARE